MQVWRWSHSSPSYLPSCRVLGRSTSGMLTSLCSSLSLDYPNWWGTGSHYWWLGLTAKCSQNPSNPGVKRRRLVWRVLLVVAPIPQWICWGRAVLILSEVSEGTDSITLPPVTDSGWLWLDQSSAPLYNSWLQSKYRNYNINISQKHSLPDLQKFPSNSVQCFLRPWYSL